MNRSLKSRHIYLPCANFLARFTKHVLFKHKILTLLNSICNLLRNEELFLPVFTKMKVQLEAKKIYYCNCFNNFCVKIVLIVLLFLGLGVL